MVSQLYEGTGQVEASFASKMLASIDENMPIWDSKVLDRIGIKSSNKRGQQKLEETIELYDVIVQWYNLNVRNKVTRASRNHEILSGVINFGNEIGFSDLVIQIDGVNYLRLVIEVFPTKIDYQNDYKQIVEDVTKEVYNVVFDFLKDGTKIEQISIETFMRKPRESMRVIAK